MFIEYVISIFKVFKFKICGIISNLWEQISRYWVSISKHFFDNGWIF